MMFNILLFIELAVAKSLYVGVNIAGFEFGCLIDGTCPIGSAVPPLSVGPAQMKHFVEDDQMNIFRLPVSWQYLVNNQIGPLDSGNLENYDQLVQACLATGAFCAIDIHNFARFNGGIIGQGGPTDVQFADLWSQLATKYKNIENMVFGLMNEPHDLDVITWTNSVQAAVTAIRNAGATSQMILLPGTNFASAGQFVSSGSGDALLQITNPDGSTDGLILDLHKYLDIDNSGEHPDCTTDNISDAFAIVAVFLRQNKRISLVSETGAGNKAASCFTDFCAQNTFINENSDVFLGYIAWAAGSFDSSYILGLSPTTQNGKLVDNAMLSQCVLEPWLSAGTAIVTAPVVSTVLETSRASTPVINIAATTTAAIETTSPSNTVQDSGSTTSYSGLTVSFPSGAYTPTGGSTSARNNGTVNGSQTATSSSPGFTSSAARIRAVRGIAIALCLITTVL